MPCIMTVILCAESLRVRGHFPLAPVSCCFSSPMFIEYLTVKQSTTQVMTSESNKGDHIYIYMYTQAVLSRCTVTVLILHLVAFAWITNLQIRNTIRDCRRLCVLGSWRGFPGKSEARCWRGFPGNSLAGQAGLECGG